MSYHSTPEGKDPQLWLIARKRSSFKRHLATYLVVNAFSWAVWYFTGGPTYTRGLPWPAWSMLGWGIGLAFHYVGAYISTGENSVEKEYDKLSQKNNPNK